MKKWLFFVFLSVLCACADKHCLEAQPYAAEMLINASNIAYRQTEMYRYEIESKVGDLLQFSKNTRNLATFSRKLDLLFKAWDYAWQDKKTANCENEILAIHQHFETICLVDTFFTEKILTASFREKVDNFPRAFAQIKAKIRANSYTQRYWYFYIRLIFRSLEAELYQLVLNAIPNTRKNYELVAYVDYEKLPQVGQKSRIKAFVLPAALRLSVENVTINGERVDFTQQGQVVARIKPQITEKQTISIIATELNPLTGETTKFKKNILLPIYK